MTETAVRVIQTAVQKAQTRGRMIQISVRM